MQTPLLFDRAVEEKENFELKPAVLHLKIDFVSHPTSGGRGWLNTNTIQLL